MSAVEPGRLPGCGMAAWVMLLGVFFLIGLTGVLVSTYSLFTAGTQLSPMRLSHGGVIDARMLKPMRAAGLLGPEEIPDAYHAENLAGTAACAISEGRLLRLSEESGPQVVRLTTITDVTGDETQVTVRSGDATITCPFNPGEGAESFKSMLENRNATGPAPVR